MGRPPRTLTFSPVPSRTRYFEAKVCYDNAVSSTIDSVFLSRANTMLLHCSQ